MTGKTRASRGIFEDVGFPPEEARQLQIRAELMIELRRVLERRKLTQAAAAKLFVVTQPRISDLVRGKIERFSIDTLIAMLSQAGIEVTVKVRRRVRAA